MALPTITNNSPAPGSIAWTQFGIQYNGGSFTIPAGNTAQKFVWWLYNGGTAPALQSGNALPALGEDDMILFLNKGGIGALVPTANLMDGSLIVGGSILAPAIGANQIQTSHLQADSVTSDIIAAGAIGADHISAGTVTADKLSVGTVSDNMVVNGSFEDNLAGYLVGWELNSVVNGTIQPVTGQSSSGAVSMQMIASTTAANLRFRQKAAQYTPVSAASGRKYYVSVRAGASTATTNGHYQRVNWYDGNKTWISSNDIRSNAALTTTFTLYEGQVTPPATAKYMGMEVIFLNPNVTTTVYIDEISAHEVTMSAQIGDGQITAAKILAGTITGDRIGAYQITGDRLLVADRTNYWENPDFELDTVGQQPKGIIANTLCRVIAGGGPIYNKDTGAIDGYSGKALEIDSRNGSNNDVYATTIFQVVPGEQYYVRYSYKHANTVGTGGTGVGFRAYNQSRTAFNWYTAASPGGAKTTTWTTLEGVWTVPNGVAFIQPWITFGNNGETTNKFIADDVIIRRMNAGELIVDGAITANKLETELVLATKIVAGDPEGTHAEMSQAGFKVYAADPGDNIPNEVVRLGVAETDDYFAVTRADGSLAATISQDGVGSFAEVNANDELYYKGEALSTILNRLPRGPLYKAELSADIDNITTEYGLVEAEFMTDGTDRQIELELGIKFYPNVAGDEAYVKVRYTIDGSAPTINSYQIFEAPLGVVSHTSYDSKSFKHTIRPHTMNGNMIPAGVRVRLLMTVMRGNGTSLRVRGGLHTYMYVNDVGPGIVHTPSFSPGGGSNPAPPPPVPAQQTYVVHWGCTNSMNYDGNGNQYTYNTNVMYQGLSPAGYGNLKSIALFGNGNNGQSMTDALSGATINYVRVHFHFDHWYYNNGGTARIGVHGHTGIPGTDWGRGPLSVISGGWPKPGARWVDLSSSHWEGFKTGAYKGVYLEGDSSYGTYGYAQRPTIEISYTK